MATVPRDNFPMDDNRSREWDANGAVDRCRKWASSDGSGDKEKISWEKYRKCFASYNAEAIEDFDSYHYPHHDVIDGIPKSIWRGVVAASQRATQFDDQEAKDHLTTEYAKYNLSPPWKRSPDSVEIRDCEEKAASLVNRTPEDVQARIFRNVPISVEEIDRVNDVVSIDGLDATAYLRIISPPVLVNHGASFEGMPVARTLKLRRGRVKGKPTQLADMQFRKPGVDWVDEIYELWLEGYLSSSIGFIPIETSYVDADGKEITDHSKSSPAGYLYRRSELVEWSVVPVPANRSAIQGASYSSAVKALFDAERKPAGRLEHELKGLIGLAGPDDFLEPTQLIGLHGVSHLMKHVCLTACPDCGKAVVYYMPAGQIMRHTNPAGEQCLPGVTKADGIVLQELVDRIRHGIDVDVPEIREHLIRSGAIILNPSDARMEAAARIHQLKSKGTDECLSHLVALAKEIDTVHNEAEQKPAEEKEPEEAIAGALAVMLAKLTGLLESLSEAEGINERPVEGDSEPGRQD